MNLFATSNVNIRKIWPILAHIYATNIALTLHLEKEYKLVLLHNKTLKEFITGDQPLVNTYSSHSKQLLSHNELEFYYPISPKLSILITRNIINSREIIIYNEDEIQKYNNMIKESCEEQIYAFSEVSLNF